MKMEEQLYQRIWQNKGAKPSTIIKSGSRVDVASLMLGSGLRLLDVGCGKGTFGALAKDRFEEVYGIDISTNALSIAEKEGIKTTTVNLNDETIPFPDEYFNMVVCLDVIEHVFDPVNLLNEINRVLVTRGELVISTPNTRYWKHIVRLLCFGMAPQTSGDREGYDGGHIHYFTFRDMCNLLNDCGFNVVEKRGTFGRNNLKEFLSTGIVIKAENTRL